MTSPYKLLIVGDSPTVFTGFGEVIRNLAQRWLPHFERIDIWGINYSGYPHKYPYDIYPAGYGDWNSPQQLMHLGNLISKNDYTHVFILCDCHNMVVQNWPTLLRDVCTKKGIKIIHYYPVDSYIAPDWLELVALSDVAVTYTQYGYDQTVAARRSVKPAILPHGVDTSVFFPREDRETTRTRCLRGWAKPDDIILLNVNRNERRKAPQHSLQIIKRVREMGVQAKLLMHCPNQSPDNMDMYNLDFMAKQLGLEKDAWAHNDSSFINGHGKLAHEGMNDLYNCADIVLSTSLGEGWGLCMHPKTPVRVRDGFVDICDIKSGDVVLTTEGYQTVTGTSSRRHDGDMIQIVVKGRSLHLPLVSTPEHRMLTKDRGWVKAADVLTSDSLAVACDTEFGNYDRTNRQRIDLAQQFDGIDVCRSEKAIWFNGSQNKQLNRFAYINKDFAELCGIYIAEGSASKGGIVFSVSQEETRLTGRIQTLVKRVWGLDCDIQDCTKSKKRWIVVYSKILKDFYAKWCGRGAKQKHIGIFDLLTRHTASKLIKGIWDGDGSYYMGQFAITTSSKTLAFQLLALGEKVGVRFCLKYQPSRDAYDLRVPAEMKENFASMVCRYKGKGVTCKTLPSFVEVRSVTRIPYSGDVHDICVDGAHNFMTHQCIAHNSFTEGAAAGCAVCLPDNTSCTEIADGMLARGQEHQFYKLPLCKSAVANSWDSSRLRYPVDVEKAAEVVVQACKDHADGHRHLLTDATKEWLSWDRIANEFLRLMGVE